MVNNGRLQGAVDHGSKVGGCVCCIKLQLDILLWVEGCEVVWSRWKDQLQWEGVAGEWRRCHMGLGLGLI